MIDLTKIDPNFKEDPLLGEKELVWRSCMEKPFQIHGIWEPAPGRFWRLPDTVRKKCNPALSYLSTNSAGGRVRFRTDADCIAVRVELGGPGLMPHMPLTGSSGVDIMVGSVFQKSVRPERGDVLLYEGFLEREGKTEDITVSLPLYNEVKNIWLGLPKEAAVVPPAPYGVEKPMVFYGSSITQGACASRPANSYPAILSKWLDADYMNLGFSGNAKGEAFLAEHIAGLSMSAFVMDYDHNAPDVEHLARTHAPFFQTIRERNPGLPILILTKGDVAVPHDPEGDARRDVIKRTYDHAVRAGDRQVFFLDGRELFGPRDRDCCTVDGCHPNDLGFMRMAERVYPVLKKMMERN